MKKRIIVALTLLFTIGLVAQNIQLPTPEKSGGMPLMEALSKRETIRDMDPERELSLRQISNLLWAAWGINRDGGKRTAPSAMNRQEIDLYVLSKEGAYKYNAKQHLLEQIAQADLRPKVSTQSFVKMGSHILILVADYNRMGKGDDQSKAVTSGLNSGYIAQNIYLFAASESLATVSHVAVDREVISQELKLQDTQKIILGQTIGYPKGEER